MLAHKWLRLGNILKMEERAIIEYFTIAINRVQQHQTCVP